MGPDFLVHPYEFPVGNRIVLHGETLSDNVEVDLRHEILEEGAAGVVKEIAAVFGGIGSVPGAMLGGILLGIIEQLSKTYISTLWADAIVFGVLVLVLVVKPTGLLGKTMNEKV